MRGTALASVLIFGALAAFLAACQFISMRRVYAEWVSISLIAAFVWTFRLWFIDERRTVKEAKSKHFDAKTLDRLIDNLRASSESTNQVVERKENTGDITAVPIATILHRSAALQQYFVANFGATRHAVLICNDPIAFAAIDMCCMTSKVELIALPAGTTTAFIQKLLESLDSAVVIAASHAAQRLCVECRAPADVLIIDRAIPPREFGAAYGSPVRIRFITEFFEGKAPRAQRKAPETPRIEPSDCYTSIYGLGEDEALSCEKVSHDAFLQLVRSHRARLSSGTHTVALCANPLAFLQQRALFYAALSLGMDVTAASADADEDILTASAISVPLPKALLLYSAAVTAAHSLWLFRKLPWVEQRLYCLFRRLHTFYAALGWIHRRLTVPSLAPRPTHVFIVDQAPIPSNVFDLLEGLYGCPVSQIAPHRPADTLTLSDGISISAAYLEAVYRLSPLVDDIFLTISASGRLVAVITPNREAIAASLRRADPVEWQEVVSDGKRAITASLRRLRRAFHLPAGCIVRDTLLVAYSLAEHSGFRGPFGEFVRPAVRRYYEGALEALGESTGPKPTSDVESGHAALHRAIRFPCAIDIGGTSCKVVFFEPATPVDLPSYCIFERLSVAYETAGLREGTWPLREIAGASGRQRGILRCMRFPTEKIPHFVEFLTAQAIPLKSVLPRVPATGGGASRFAALIAAQTGVALVAQSEFATAVAGLNFLLETVPNAIVRYDVERDEAVPAETAGEPWPYLLVNVGSGISILRCDAPGDFRRVSGSALGGGTFWGLCRLLTNATTWEEIDELTRVDGPGDAAAVDLLVRDIYGQGAAVPGDLRPDTLASSFGKLASRGFRAAPKASDYVRSLLLMMSYNITQIAFLWSQNLGVRNVYFCGGFLQNNSVVMRHIAQSMAYWTAADAVEAKFVRHNGYLGAIGGLLCEA